MKRSSIEVMFQTGGFQRSIYSHTGYALIVRSPFRAKYHVVVQYMARWMNCPLPPSPSPLSPLDPPPPAEKTMRTRENQRHDRQGTSHCSCLEHCFLYAVTMRYMESTGPTSCGQKAPKPAEREGAETGLKKATPIRSDPWLSSASIKADVSQGSCVAVSRVCCSFRMESWDWTTRLNCFPLSPKVSLGTLV